jgi:DNA-directed RNA polymerase specialized sigma24 family protein
MGSFCRALRQGRLEDLADRNDFLRLVLRMTARKAADLIRRETTRRRGEGHVRGDSALDGLDSASGDHPLADAAAAPELAALVADQVRHLLAVLDDPVLETMALAKAEGLTNQELAERFRCSKRTVARRLHLIRAIWEAEQSP